MKKLCILALSFFILTPLQANTPEEKGATSVVLLENEVLHIVDGNPLAINGTTIGMMLHLRSELGKRRQGAKGTDGKLTGMYTYEGVKHTLKSLIELEDQLLNNPTAENQKKLQDLHVYFNGAIKDEFLKLVAPFLDDARGAKDQMVRLITEWAQKTKRMNSHLLAWSQTKEGNESTAIKENIPTIRRFDEFCSDLVNFLESLMRSCPKACQQFKDILEQKQKEKQNQSQQK